MHYACCLLYNSLFDRDMPYEKLKGYYLYVREELLKNAIEAANSKKVVNNK